jgi:hypothetical protein
MNWDSIDGSLEQLVIGDARLWVFREQGGWTWVAFVRRESVLAYPVWTQVERHAVVHPTRIEARQAALLALARAAVAGWTR